MTFQDHLSVDTPEQTLLEFDLAGIGSRFLALALDTMIQAGVFLLEILLFWPAGGTPWSGGMSVVLAFIVLSNFILYYGYYAVFEAVWNGQTPGKRALRLRVIKDSGHPISAQDSIARNLMRIIDQLPVIYGVGIASALISSRSQRLGDLLAGTVVVRERQLEEVHPEWGAPRAGAAPIPTVTRLQIQELRLIETFLERRSQLESGVRVKMAHDIANRIGERLGVPRETRREPEPFLEAVAHQHRKSGGLGG